MSRAKAGTGAIKRVRYAVVGLGHIAQAAVLPAFANARRQAVLAALVSDDEKKLRVLGRRYEVGSVCDYAAYEDLLASGDIDAVYIALPNSMHLKFVERAAAAGVHVLCEKPLGVTAKECEAMIRACERGKVRLMTAYRLHFEAANLEAVRVARSGAIGELRVFSSVFTMQVKDEDNIRLKSRFGGGPLHDIGIYCINAARSLFAEETSEVFALAGNSGDARFKQVDETVAAVMKFSAGRVATFACSFGAADVASYRLVGTKGDVRLDPAYEYAEGLAMVTTRQGKKRSREFGKRDQFAAELIHFSECIRQGRDPEPDGREGLADVRVIEAIQRSMDTGRAVAVEPTRGVRHPRARQRIDRPGVRKRKHVNANGPSED